MTDIRTMLRAFDEWWNAKGEKWRTHEAGRRRDYQQVFAAGYEARGRDDLVARGMTIVHRLQVKHAACTANPHGDTHCWHWRGEPPTLHTEVQADCCWCGQVQAFGYQDVVPLGSVPVSPSPGAVHGTARDWLDQPTTYALGRLSVKGAARQHAQKMAAPDRTNARVAD